MVASGKFYDIHTNMVVVPLHDELHIGTAITTTPEIHSFVEKHFEMQLK